MTSSPLRPGASLDEELDYYKRQYEQLETDLADFQASSKELEEQLERDIETAEKNERKLREQVEKLNFEVEEWKTKHNKAKTEANSAQNALQKEITTIREANRAMQMKLRDIEVMNDDYERQARNTESSLEDMESKYNVTIERGVLLEEEVKAGEQEREALRIETQRLRDDLGDLKVESEITLEKLRLADETIERLRSRKPSPFAVESLRARSPGSEVSGVTPSSPTASTPPPKSDSISDIATPPSPPLSDTPANGKPGLGSRATARPKRRSLIPDAGVTPRPGLHGPRAPPTHSRGPSLASSNGVPATDAKAMKPPARPVQTSRPSNLGTEGLPRSESLYQMRSLRGRMQKIEERVHSARAKCPPPAKNSTPKRSPRVGSTLGDNIPSSVTMRRSIRRPGSNIGSQADGASDIASEAAGRRQSGIKRLSFGIPRPPSAAGDRPPSAMERPPSAMERPPSAAAASRLSSRASFVSGSGIVSGRPSSRAGAQTPLGLHAGTNGASNPNGIPARPRSSIGGMYATVHGTPRSHRPSASISELRRRAAESEDSPLSNSPTAQRSTIDRTTFAPSGTLKRQSAGLQQPKTLSKRTSIGSVQGNSFMKPPPPRRKMSDVGETY